MKLIAVIEDRGGMMFNHRRVSKDRELVLRVEELIKGHRLWIHPCSADLFPDAIVDGNFLGNAGEEDFCFVEDCSVKGFENRVQEVFLFHWNRRYPADIFFDLPMDQFSLVHTEEIKGYSHEKITLETWK